MARAEILSSLAAGVFAKIGEDFFQTLVTRLAEILQVRFSFICECMDRTCEEAGLLAFAGDRPFRTSSTYRLIGTPCELVRGQPVVVYRDGIQSQFGRDPWIRDAGVESYAAVRLQGGNGHILGHLGIMDDRPLDEADSVVAALQIFALRAAAEIERRRTTEALKAQRDRAQAIFELAGVAMVLVDRDERVALINQRGCEVLGCERSEILGRNWFGSFVPAHAQEEIRALFRSALAEDLSASRYCEYPLLHCSGSERLLGWRIAPMRDASGEASGILSAGEDITERERAAQALRESERRLSTVTASVPGVVFEMVSDAQGRFRLPYVSKGAAELFGLSAQELEERPEQLLERIARADRASFEDSLQRGGRGGPIWSWEGRVMRGRADQVRVSGRAQRSGSEGEQVLWSGIFLDVTEERRREAELKRSRRELRRLAAYLQSVREQERAAIARELHDEMGQALTALKLDLARFREGICEDRREVLDQLDAMMRSVDGTIHVVQRILSELRPALLDDLGLAAAAEWLVEQFERRTGTRCTLALGAELPALPGEQSTALFRILQESLTNVARHAEANAVSVRLTSIGKWLVLEVADDGKGITRGQLRSTKSLGLLAMRERVHVLGGDLTVHGQPGVGTVVRARIPLAPPRSQEEDDA